jgi:hypothetical protein
MWIKPPVAMPVPNIPKNPSAHTIIKMTAIV